MSTADQQGSVKNECSELRKQNSQRLKYSLDILTDGSENTGHGTIFLTVTRSPKYRSNLSNKSDDVHQIKSDEACLLKESKIQARYALTGLSSLTSRLAADQNFKLSSIRALFCPSRSDVECTAGIPSLLLALSKCSLTGNLNVIGPEGIDVYMEEMANLILGKNRKYPRIFTCVVPDTIHTTEGKKRDNSSIWWKIFEDEFIFVYARAFHKNYHCDKDGKNLSTSLNTNLALSSSQSASCSRNTSFGNKRVCGSAKRCNISICSSQSIVYIVSLRGVDQRSTTNTDSCCHTYSFAVLPPDVDTFTCHNILHPLPKVIMPKTTYDSGKKRLQNPLRFILYLNPKEGYISGNSAKHWLDPSLSRSNEVTEAKPHLVSENEVNDEKSYSFQSQRILRVHSNFSKISKLHLATIPNDNEGKWDEGLLIRASHQATVLHKSLPFAFPLHLDSSSESKQLRQGINRHGINRGHSLNTKANGENDIFNDNSLVLVEKLRSCTSILLQNVNSADGSSTPFQTICRKGLVLSKVKSKVLPESVEHEISNRYGNDRVFQASLSRLAHLYSRSHAHFREEDEMPTNSAYHDSNEIEISDESSELSGGSTSSVPRKRTKYDYASIFPSHSNIEMDITRPHLLTLGTGCASPSPLRGSSGYALLLPTMSTKPNYNDGRGGIKNYLTLSALVECGEGCITAISRFLPQCCYDRGNRSKKLEVLAQVCLIWISHSHLDHFSDLAVVVQKIYSFRDAKVCRCLDFCAKDNSDRLLTKRGINRISANRESSSCPWCRYMRPPIVIAPKKVLRFLDLSLNCKNGYQLKRKGLEERPKGDEISDVRLYVGISNRDFDTSPFAQQIRDSLSGFELLLQDKKADNFSCDLNEYQTRTYRPFAFITSVPVEHCPDSYALILGLNMKKEVSNLDDQIRDIKPSSPSNLKHIGLFYFCYSGDTRPSSNLVRACQQLASFGDSISLLLHEATFDDDEKGKREAICKRHCTVREALQIGERIKCKACILTHISKRYQTLSSGYKFRQQHANVKFSGIATDGMILPLEESFAAGIPLLSQCSIQVLENLLL